MIPTRSVLICQVPQIEASLVNATMVMKEMDGHVWIKTSVTSKTVVTQESLPVLIWKERLAVDAIPVSDIQKVVNALMFESPNKTFQ